MRVFCLLLYYRIPERPRFYMLPLNPPARPTLFEATSTWFVALSAGRPIVKLRPFSPFVPILIRWPPSIEYQLASFLVDRVTEISNWRHSFSPYLRMRITNIHTYTERYTGGFFDFVEYFDASDLSTRPFRRNSSSSQRILFLYGRAHSFTPFVFYIPA